MAQRAEDATLSTSSFLVTEKRVHVVLRGQDQLVRQALMDGLGVLEAGLDGSLGDVAQRDVQPAGRRHVHRLGHGDATELQPGDLLARCGVLQRLDQHLHGVLVGLLGDDLEGLLRGAVGLHLLSGEDLGAHHVVDEALDDVELGLAEPAAGSACRRSGARPSGSD